MNTEQLLEFANRFAIDAPATEVKPLGEGFINDTFVVKTAGTHRYILQRKNHYVFPDVPAMMENIHRVTAHLRSKVLAAGGNPEREVLTLIPTTNGALYTCDSEGNFWAMCLFIEDSVTHNSASSLLLARKGGEGIGRFQAMLADFEGELKVVIKGFHDMRYRFTQWDATVAADAAHRVKDCAEEISWIETRRKEMMEFWELVENGTIPKRIAHNDTKLSNILFDKNDNVLCVIDLDTVMSATALNDFGDAIRSYANNGAEDDKDLSRVSVNLDVFKAYAEGYLAARRPTMTQSEIDWLAFSARFITFEQVLRFLMDYLDGDKYYKIAYPDHNLVRTRAQYRLLQSLEAHYPELQQIIATLA